MEAMAALIESSEDWIIQRVIGYARERGYVKYTSTLAEAWRVSVSRLSESLIDALVTSSSPPELSPEEDYSIDPIAAFGILEAKRHRKRGVTLGMFLGLMKYYRQSYIDLIGDSDFEAARKEMACRYIDRFFDRVELGFCMEWAALGEGEKTRELQSTNRRMTNEKNKYLTIFESLYDPAVLFDKKCNVIGMNHAAQERFCQGGVPGASYYSDEDCAPGFDWISDDIESLVRSGDEQLEVEKRVSSGGAEFNYRVKLKKMLDVSGKFKGFVALFHDVTDLTRAQRGLRKANEELEGRVKRRTKRLTQANIMLKKEIDEREEAQRALLDSEARYQDLYDGAPAAYLTIGGEGKIRQANKAAGKMFGLEAAHLRGMRFIDLISEAAPGDRETIGELIEDGRRIDNLEILAQSVIGAEVHGLLCLHPIIGEHGNVIESRAIITDIGERKKLEEQLLHAQKMNAIGKLAGGVAHDFNNQLTVILAVCDGLFERMGDDRAIREDLELLRAAGESGASLTRQLLTFSRKTMIRPKIMDLNECVSGVQKMLVRLLGEDIELQTGLWEKELNIKADPIQIEQILLNLVINARDAMPRGGKVFIETLKVAAAEAIKQITPGAGRAAAFASLSVTDTGLGMDDVVKGQIFEPFFTTKEQGRGTGLGLSTVYGIARQSGGDITVSSRPGLGSTFRVYLPLADEEAKAQKVPDLCDDKTSAGETILIVEDESSIRMVAKKMLTECGYKVLEAGSGEEAIDIGKRNRGKIDLTLADVVIRGKKGGELAVELSKMNPQMKTLFMSGYSDETVLARGGPGMYENFIEKPFTKKTLAAKIRESLSGAKAGAGQ